MIFFLIVVAVWVPLAWWLTRPTSDRDVASFAAAYAVPLTESNVELLRSTLQRSRRFRLAGAVIAVIAGVVAFKSLNGWAFFGYVAAGYAGGSLADEMTRRRPSGGNAARLERRTVRTFVQWWVLLALGVAALVATAQIIVALRLTPGGGWFMYAPNSTDSLSLSPLPSTGAIYATAVIAAAVTIAGAVLLRRLALAPTPAGQPDREAANHAIRTAAVLSVAGATMMVLGVIAARLANATVQHDGAHSEWFRQVNNLSLLVGLATAFIGANLSLRAFPRGSWFRFQPDLPASRSAEPS